MSPALSDLPVPKVTRGAGVSRFRLCADKDSHAVYRTARGRVAVSLIRVNGSAIRQTRSKVAAGR